MQCPYCQQSAEYLTEEALYSHIVVSHPEKTNTAEAFGKAQEKAMRGASLASLAVQMTNIAISHPEVKVDEIISKYMEFYQKLSEWV